jgi:hypothetical protein
LVKVRSADENAGILIKDILNMTWTIKTTMEVVEGSGTNLVRIDANPTDQPHPDALAVMTSLDDLAHAKVAQAITVYLGSARQLSEVVAAAFSH